MNSFDFPQIEEFAQSLYSEVPEDLDPPSEEDYDEFEQWLDNVERNLPEFPESF
jgi:hypothetical protein